MDATHALLRYLLDREPGISNLGFSLRDVAPVDEVPNVDGRALQDLLLEAWADEIVEGRSEHRRARARLAQGAKADAVTAAVEEALKAHLLTMAAEHGVSVTRAGGAPLAMSSHRRARRRRSVR